MHFAFSIVPRLHRWKFDGDSALYSGSVSHDEFPMFIIFVRFSFTSASRYFASFRQFLSGVHVELPRVHNQSLQATRGFACLFVVAQVPRAPEFGVRMMPQALYGAFGPIPDPFIAMSEPVKGFFSMQADYIGRGYGVLHWPYFPALGWVTHGSPFC